MFCNIICIIPKEPNEVGDDHFTIFKMANRSAGYSRQRKDVRLRQCFTSKEALDALLDSDNDKEDSDGNIDSGESESDKDFVADEVLLSSPPCVLACQPESLLNNDVSKILKPS